MPESISLERRKLPTQKRARASVDRILDATAALLDDVGFDDLSTNAIAERADVNVASVYKYFPNKYAVVAALGERFRDQQVDMLRTTLAPREDWRAALAEVLEAMTAMFLETPGFAALSATLAASPVLRPIDEQSLADEARAIADALPGFGIQSSRTEREAVARITVEAVRGVLPLVRRSKPATARRLLRELHLLLERYLAGYLEADRAASSRKR